MYINNDITKWIIMNMNKKISLHSEFSFFRLMSCLFPFLLSIFILLPIFSSCVKAGEQPKEGQPLESKSKSEMEEMLVRSSAVSGQFYPASAKKLKGMIRQFLKLASPQEDSGNLIALVCPHAGYIYSGEIAAYSYKLLEGKKIDTVILLGPSHRFSLRGASIWPRGVYKTPFGEVKVNEQMATLIADSSDSISFKSQAHLQEHSLEVQLPFLQVVLQEFQIVPILIGKLSPKAVEEIGQKLAAILKKPGSLLVISSDLSHYHSYDEAAAMDKKTLETIQARDCEKLKGMLNYGEAELCGAMPVILLLETIKQINQPANIRLLKYANSGDTAGTKERVVGYAALSVLITDKNGKKQSDLIERGEGKLAEAEDLLNKQEQEKLLDIARSSINAYLARQDLPEFDITEPRLLEPRGVFVTLHKKGMLRGCIGYIKAIMPLYKAASDCAISAAVKDYRFPPLKDQELDEIDIEISALTPLRKIGDINQIKVGEHGLYVSRSPYSGLLLPQVATEYGWDRLTFLAQTCIKAGLPKDAWEKGADIYIFSAQIFGEKEK
jgi:AmmeMemoRadiSam system protein B/AmmeMemoRadiSam system protein A